MAAFGNVSADTLKGIVSAVWQADYERNPRLPGLIDRSHEADVAKYGYKLIPIDRTTYSSVDEAYQRNDDTNWTFPPPVTMTTDELRIEPTRVRKWAQAMLADQPVGNAEGMIAQFTQKQAQQVALDVDKHIYDAMVAASIGANAGTGFQVNSAGNILNTSGANMGKMSGSGDDDNAAVYDLFRRIALTLRQANLAGQGAANPQSWTCFTSEFVLSALREYLLEQGGDAMKTAMVLGRDVPTIFGIPVVTSTVVQPTKRTAANLDTAASSSGKNALPLLFFNRAAMTYGKAVEVNQVFTPTDYTGNTAQYLWRGTYSYFLHLLDARLMYRGWIRTEA